MLKQLCLFSCVSDVYCLFLCNGPLWSDFTIKMTMIMSPLSCVGARRCTTKSQELKNMTKALDDAGVDSVGCLAHTLQLSVKAGLESQRAMDDDAVAVCERQQCSSGIRRLLKSDCQKSSAPIPMSLTRFCRTFRHSVIRPSI